MIPKPIRLLILEDSPTDLELMLREFQKQALAYVFINVQTEEEFSDGIDEFVPDLILADYGLPHYDGFSAMKLAQKKCPDTPLIFVSGTLGEESAIEALKCGATDYVLKQRLSRLGPAVQRALHEAEERSQRRRAEEQLRRSHDQLRALAARLQSIREEDRTHIAREIHDDLAQDLTALKIDLACLSDSLAPAPEPADRQRLQQKLADLTKLTDTAIEAVHRIATELRPVVLDKMGLYSACRWLAGDFHQRTSVECDLTLPGKEVPLENDCATALFRILQESLTNVARHAHASRVKIQLAHENNLMLLAVEDNGRGIELSEIEDLKSIGLLGMSERAHLLGGDFNISGSLGRGTTVRAQIPVRPEAQPRGVGIDHTVDHHGQIQKALRRNKDYLRLIMDTVPALIAYVDPDFRYVLANQTYQEWFGENPEKMRGRHVREVLGEAAWAQIQPHMRRALSGEQVTYEHEFPAQGGSRWHHITCTPDRDAQGQVLGLVVLVQDITEQKKAEKDLRESQAREQARRMELELLMETVPAAVWIAHDAKCQKMTSNKAGNELLGMPEGANVSVSAPESERPKHFQIYKEGQVCGPDELPIQKAARTGQAIPGGELELRFTDGSSRWLFGNAVPLLDTEGKVRGALGAFVEITRRKQMEKALMQVNRTLEARISERTARLMQINQDLEREIRERQATQAELLCATSRLQALSRKLLRVQEEERRQIACELHDGIGQALTALKINLQSMQRFPEPASAEKRLQDAVEILNQMLEQVRGLSLALRPPLLQELGLVAALRNHLELQGQWSGLAVEFKSSGTLSRLDPAVETACFRVAQEAITNAVRHAKASGIVLSLTQEQNRLILSVRDNGIGYEPELALLQSERGGSLGLIGMQERAVLIGGKIIHRSAPNEGTEIRAEFPLSGREPENLQS